MIQGMFLCLRTGSVGLVKTAREVVAGRDPFRTRYACYEAFLLYSFCIYLKLQISLKGMAKNKKNKQVSP